MDYFYGKFLDKYIWDNSNIVIWHISIFLNIVLIPSLFGYIIYLFKENNTLKNRLITYQNPPLSKSKKYKIAFIKILKEHQNEKLDNTSFNDITDVVDYQLEILKGLKKEEVVDFYMTNDNNKYFQIEKIKICLKAENYLKSSISSCQSTQN